MKKQVFLSYARKDVDRVRPLASALETVGYDVWWDVEIPAGRQFANVIEEALETSAAAVVIWSEHSVASEWVEIEAAEAKKRGHIVPVLIDDVSDGIPLEFRRTQAASLVGWRGNEDAPAFVEFCKAIELAIRGESPDAALARSKRKRLAARRRNRLVGTLLGIAVLLAAVWGIVVLSGPEGGSGPEGPAPVVAPRAPELLTPLNGERLGALQRAEVRRPSFRWSRVAVDVGEFEGYEIQLDRDPGFGAAESQHVQEPVYRPGRDLEVNANVPVGDTYYWRVRTLGNGTSSDWSMTYRFELGRGGRDVNGDGFDDLLVGDPTHPGEFGRPMGRLALYYGSPSRFATDSRSIAPDVQFSITDNIGDSELGKTCALVDLDGDGLAEVIAGERGLNGKGRVWIWRGRRKGPDTAERSALRIEDGFKQDGQFGWSIGPGGDLNADGFADLIVGHGGPGIDGETPGAVSVYMGGANFDGSAHTRLAGEAPFDLFGRAVAGVGDLNDDGFDDFVVGAPGAGSPRTSQQGPGVVYVYFGSDGVLSEDPVQTLTFEGSREYGSVLAPAGDVNGDGCADLLVGDTGTMTVHLYLGGRGDSFDPEVDGATTSAGDSTLELAFLGDLDRDGYSEFAVGALLHEGVTVYSGGERVNLSRTSAFSQVGESTTTGASMGWPGDFNGDGHVDLAVTTRDVPGPVGIFFGSGKTNFSGAKRAPELTVGGAFIF